MDIREIGTEQTAEHLLDIKGHFHRGEVNALAICEHCTTARDVNKKPFVRYTLRDVMGRRIAGRQFDITDFAATAANMKNMQDRVVMVNGKLDHFGTMYISVAKCEPVNRNIDEQIRDKFFVKPISNWAQEKELYVSSASEILSADIQDLFKELSIEFTLDNSFNIQLYDGLKGSSVVLINTFNNSLAQITGQSGKLLMAANILVEAIMTKAKYDPVTALEELSEIQRVILSNITVERRKILDIAIGSIYLYFGFDRTVFSADSLLVNTVRDFVLKVTMQQEFIKDNSGVFNYEGVTLSRGEI